LATPQSFKFNFPIMTALERTPFYQGQLYIAMLKSWNEA